MFNVLNVNVLIKLFELKINYFILMLNDVTRLHWNSNESGYSTQVRPAVLRKGRKKINPSVSPRGGIKQLFKRSK